MSTSPALSELRDRIEAVDREILARVAERVQLARRVGEVKREAAASPLDPSREAAVIRRAVAEARALGLPEEPVRNLFWTLIELCRNEQIQQ